MANLRPMLATDYEEGRLRFPYYASPKLDGIRCLVVDGVARTRSMKRFPNLYVDAWFKEHAKYLEGLDGELVIGDPTASNCFSRTTSGLMSIDGRPSFSFFVFDFLDWTGRLPFTVRADQATELLHKAKANGRTEIVNSVDWLVNRLVTTRKDLGSFEDTVLKFGYEGVMLRDPTGRYKQGRATLNEGTLLKVKRFKDAEAIIVGIEEQQHNTNVAFKNELGRTKRSSAQAGMVGKGTAGALIVKGAPGQAFAGIQFNVGTGMDDELRATIWRQRDKLTGLGIKYRYFDIGVKDAPRHPVFLGFRKAGS